MEPVVVRRPTSAADSDRLRRAETRMDRGSSLVGFGMGLAGGAASMGAVLGHPGRCYDDGGPTYVPQARVAGGVFGGVGLALALTGGGLMLSIPPADRRALAPYRAGRISRGGRMAIGVASGLFAGVVSVVLFSMAGIGECMSS